MWLFISLIEEWSGFAKRLQFPVVVHTVEAYLDRSEMTEILKFELIIRSTLPQK